MTALETKGDQLDNADTACKRDALSVLSDNFPWDHTTPGGELELVTDTGETVECTHVPHERVGITSARLSRVNRPQSESPPP